MADEKKRSFIISLLESMTMMNLAVTVIGLGLMSAVTWFIVNKGDHLTEANVIKAFVTFLIALGVLALILIGTIHFVFKKIDPDVVTDSVAREIIKRMMEIPPMQVVATVVGLTTIGAIVWFLFSDSNAFGTADKVRGLITFSVAMVTVAIALILVFFIVFSPKSDGQTGIPDDLKEKFTFGKDILMVFVGILGTIMGFYYGTGQVSTKDLPAIKSIAKEDSGSSVLLNGSWGIALETDTGLTDAKTHLQEKAINQGFENSFILKRPEGYRVVAVFKTAGDAANNIDKARGINPTVSEPKNLDEWCLKPRWVSDQGYFDCGS